MEYKNDNWERKQPFFTIVTPFYNRRITLARAFHSVEIQTFKNFEYIIVDDGSEEDNDDIVFEFMRNASFPVLYLKKENGGVHTARNLGTQYARGTLITYLDSDDELLQNALEVMTKTWKAIPDKTEYMGIKARCKNQTLEKKSDKFPDGINEMPSDKQNKCLHRIQGDKHGCRVTKIMKENPWPEPDGITFVTENILWKRLEKQYKYYFINDIVLINHMDAEESYTRSKVRNLQYCINQQWNFGYRLNDWKIYRGLEESWIKVLAQYCVFTSILKKCDCFHYLKLKKNIDKAGVIFLKIPSLIVARKYIQKKMKSELMKKDEV